MKIIKKIAAIMLSVMMVLGMCSVVGAADGSTGTGEITINKAAPGETYKIYRILDLESYSGNNYAYKLRDTSSEWNTFIKQDEISGKNGYVTLDGDYVTWKSGVADDKAAEFAKKALDYAKIKSIAADVEKKLSSEETSVTFGNLPLGYYLVETSVGTVLALDTTKPKWEIDDKNVAPTVEKKVQEDSKVGATDEYGESNTADIGQTVNFKTTITAQAGAQNYVLHDKMDKGLTFSGSVSVTKGNQTFTTPTDYNLVMSTPTAIEDGCTFEIVFTSDFCNKLKAGDEIVVTYSATLNEEAVIARDGNKNETWLKYGDSSVTTHKTTTTKTYEIPVFKYTKKTAENKTGLPNAEFTLSKNSDGTNPIELVDITNGAAEGKYRVAKTGDTTITKVITLATGKFTIQGLDADTYYLTETKQPDGYNKLSKAVKIVIDEEGKITVDDGATSTKLVEVENKTGSLLPSTGGMGTTLFYIFGAILVIGSGVVLITKKRMK